MAALSDEVKRFIVLGLACYDTPSQVADGVKEAFGLTVPRQQIETYDPDRRAGRALSAKWCELFEATRASWRKEVMDIPIANKISRLRALDRLMHKAECMRNYGLALQALQQAAREVGDMYVSRRSSGCEVGPGSTLPAPEPVQVLRPDEPVPCRPIL